MNIAEDGVHGVISLNCLVDSWVWRSLTLNFLLIFLVLIDLISPLIILLLLRWLILLIFIIILSMFLVGTCSQQQEGQQGRTVVTTGLRARGQ
jgi:hypothetical protein